MAEQKYPEGDPSTDWTTDQLKAYAADNEINLKGTGNKGEIVDRIEGKTQPPAASTPPESDAPKGKKEKGGCARCGGKVEKDAQVSSLDPEAKLCDTCKAEEEQFTYTQHGRALAPLGERVYA